MMTMDSAPMTHSQRNHVPPGTRNGRWWSGYFLRSMITAGIWKMYIIAVSEMITETMTPKKVARLPSAMQEDEDHEDGADDRREDVHGERRALLAELAEPEGRRAVQAGHGLDAHAALLPHAAGADDGEDDERADEPVERLLRAAEHARRPRRRRRGSRRRCESASPFRTSSTPRIIEPVMSDGDEARAQDHLGDVLLRVRHLLGRAARELEADEHELQQADDGQEPEERRLEVARP